MKTICHNPVPEYITKKEFEQIYAKSHSYRSCLWDEAISDFAESDREVMSFDWKGAGYSNGGSLQAILKRGVQRCNKNYKVVVIQAKVYVIKP